MYCPPVGQVRSPILNLQSPVTNIGRTNASLEDHLPPVTNIGRTNACLENIIPGGDGAVFGEYIVMRDGMFSLADTTLQGSSLTCEVKNLSECMFVKNLQQSSGWESSGGEGSGCVVRLIKHKVSNNLYALKEMHLGNQQRALQQMRELKINKDILPYDHVVTFHQAFYSHGKLSLLFEYMDGGSLAEVIAFKGEIEDERYLSEIAKQALKGLDWLHRAKVIHRGIKPSSLLLNRKGQVKIADFGISKILEHSADMANTGVGTEHYMSPERINGSAPYDASCDLWSLGLTLLECTMGRNPYAHTDGGKRSLFELQNAILQGPVPQAGDNFSEAFRNFISKCIQKNPRDRATIPDLLCHEFIARYIGSTIDVSDLLPQHGVS